MWMNKGIISDELYARLLFWVLIAMIVAVPSSRFLMSVSQFSFGALWLAHGHYKEKWRAFIHNKPAVVLTSLFFLHLLGVLYSTDLDYALKDIRTKLPILIIPFMFSSFPKISHTQFEKLLYFFIGSVLFVSFFVTISHFVTNEEVRHIISREFISHIRFSLSVTLSIFYLVFLRVNTTNRNGMDIFSIVILFWLIFFLFFLEAFTGIIVFFLLMFSVLLFLAFHSSSKLKKYILLSVILIGAIGITSYLVSFYKSHTQIEEIDLEHLETRTASGNIYYHKPEAGVENGKYIYIYMNEKELRKAWKRKSLIPYDSTDHLNQHIKFTLIRYLTSKNLRKDKEGVEALQLSDVKNIENGIANYEYTQGIGIESRLLKILFEYQNYVRTGDPSGHSVMQRVEYWKTAWRIIEKNFWFGVGTGDMNVAFDQEYQEMNSKLKPEARLRAHNQYLSIWVGLGFIGLLWFLFALIFPAWYSGSFKNLFYLIFFIAFTVSLFTEDTIETQAGVTLFIYFNSLFLFLYDTHNNQYLSTSSDD